MRMVHRHYDGLPAGWPTSPCSFVSPCSPLSARSACACASSSLPFRGGNYSGIHASGFRDFLLKAELLRAVVDCGFEHPSEVQHECIPQAILGMDVLCQAKSGMGKT